MDDTSHGIMAAFLGLRAPPPEPVDLCTPLLPTTSCTPSDAPTPADQTEPSPWTQVQPNPRPRHPAPLHPHFGMTEDIRLEPIESEAMRVMKLDRPPCQLDIERMLDLIPRCMLKRGDGGCTYVVGGASPRCRDSLLTLSIDLPYFNFIVCKYVHWIAPTHKFTTFVLRKGAVERPHRDTRNAPFPSQVQAFRTPCWELDGLWVQDVLGTVTKQHLNESVVGRIQPLRMPFVFDARRLLHAGHVHDPTRISERLILVAFCTIHTSTLSEAMRSRLYGLGFNVPSPYECFVALHGKVPGDPPRLRQLSLLEFFNLGSGEECQHDIIEVAHVHDSQSQEQ